MSQRPDITGAALFDAELRVISAGIEGFTEDLRRQSVPVVALDWQPPAEGKAELVRVLKAIYSDPDLLEKIDRANEEVIERIQTAAPRIVDVVPAGEAMHLPDRTVLHAGPPITWQRMCGPQKRAVMGAIQFEGWADSNDEAADLVQAGGVQLSPCARYNAVGPMTGIMSPSMPVLVAHHEAADTYAFSTFNEGRGNTLWFGVFDEGTLERLRWIRDTLGPAMKAALREHGPLDVFEINAQGLQMGDDCHARHAACTALVLGRLMPAMLEAGVPSDTVASVIRYIDGNSHFFLNFTMAAVKATMDAAHGVPYSTVVTAMARNGEDFMLRVGGMGNRWFVAPVSQMENAVYYTGFSVEDAAGDIGDSAIIETCGLGGMALAAAPTMAVFVGGTLADEVAAVKELDLITLAKHDNFRMPAMDSENTPLGIDVRRAVETRVVPFITTGVLHETSATTGQIGTGVAHAPIAAFDRALVALAREWGCVTEGPLSGTVVEINPEPVPIS